jgi:uncharacterized protein YfaT (DUF1175 family)
MMLCACEGKRSGISADRTAIEADGRSTARISANAPIRWDAEAANELGVHVLAAHDGSLILRAGHAPGSITFTAKGESISVTLQAAARDDDEDGFPDAAELMTEEARASFTRWFTAIAEAQATRIDDAWPKVHHDCAGLVRYAMKEALRLHDPAWLEKRGTLLPIGTPDVGVFHYPNLPFIGDRLFRTIGGAFDPVQTIDAQFSAFSDARTLWQLNTSFVSRDVREARAGDLLFFSVPFGQSSRMHTMIALGKKKGATHRDPAARLVYHTGADGEHEGEVRLVTLDMLDRHPDEAWHPRADNPRFLGVHRLSMLDFLPRRLAALDGTP